jgi:hypothetical protein
MCAGPSQQRQRVDIDAVSPRAEVHHPTTCADRVTTTDTRTGAHRDRLEESHGGSHPVRMPHHHEQLAADLPCERDNAVGR